ncbi:MAG: rod-binding protein [Magnetococcales bacterium]|nr:rod-binding protein [Magnetococcales bacterium]
MSSNIPVQLPDNAYTNSLPAGERKRLKEAVADFEAIFVRQMLGAMRKTIPDEGDKALIKKGNGEKIFQDMLDSEYADRVSRRPNGLGLKEILYQKMTEGKKPLGVSGSAGVPGAPGAVGVPGQVGSQVDKLKSNNDAFDAALAAKTKLAK